ncbi:MAG: hypothetical protein FWD25_10240 [Clostridia bacterium]|nr:hypothetical protein [Clostridia bacterium]
MNRSSKIIFILFAMLVSLAMCFPMAAAETPQQAEAIALVTEKTLEDIEALRASSKNLWVAEMLANTSIEDATAGEPNKSGAIPVHITVTYPALASGVDAKTPFSGDAEAFLRAALDNAMSNKDTFVLQATVTFREGRDPAVKWHDSKGFSGFRTALNSKARAAVTSFSSKPMVAAFTGYVFQHPVRSPKIDLTNGPRAMKLTGTAPDQDRMFTYAVRTAITRAAYEAQGPNTETETLSALLNEQIAAYGKDFTSSNAKKAPTDQAVSLTFDPWTLLEGKNDASTQSAYEYRAEYSSNYTSYEFALLFRVRMLPDVPALPMPKTEQLRGVRKGVQIVISAKKGDGNRMISFTKDGELQSLCFIRDGERVTIYIPAGTYTVMMGSGTIWYGEEELFGPNIGGIAGYSTSIERFSNPGEGRYWRFTLSSPETGGNMDALDKGDFVF